MESADEPKPVEVKPVEPKEPSETMEVEKHIYQLTHFLAAFNGCLEVRYQTYYYAEIS